MAIDLESLGEHKVNIECTVLGLELGKPISGLVDIDQRLEVLLEMLDGVLSTYDAENPSVAQ